MKDPTVDELEKYVERAVARAAEARATLVFAYIGHASISDRTNASPLFLLPLDADPERPDGTGYQIGHHLARQRLEDLDGLIVLLDACQAGQGVRDVSKEALEIRLPVRLELVAGTFLAEARDACFSRSLIELMERGDPKMSLDYFGIREVANKGRAGCRKLQEPPTWVGAGHGLNGSDPGLWVTRNVAGGWLLSGTSEGALAIDLTRDYQLTSDVERVLHAVYTQPLVMVVGEAGSGKSTLFAALTRPELLPNLIPTGFHAAIAFTSVTNTVLAIAESLHGQLVRGRPTFMAAYEVFREASGDFATLPALERLVFGPLRVERIPVWNPVHLAIDGIDQLQPVVRRDLLTHLRGILKDEALSGVRILLNSRPGDHSPLEVQPLTLAAPSRAELGRYAASRRLSVVQESFATGTAATWLEARLALTGTSIPTGIGSASTPSPREAYRQLISELASDGDTGSLLWLLAAAGSGPVLPLNLAVEAANQMRPPYSRLVARNALTVLGDVATRAQAGTPDELIGLVHDTIAVTIAEEWPDEVLRAHQAILDVVDAVPGLATATYAADHRADHLWALSRYDEALATVRTGLGHSAPDNLRVLATWTERAATATAIDDPRVLTLRVLTANWTAKTGDIATALTQLEAAHADQVRKLGPDHAETLGTRDDIAIWTALNRDLRGARTLFQVLLRDQTRLFGARDPRTLMTRFYLCELTNEIDGPRPALTELGALLKVQAAALGPYDQSTLLTRRKFAELTALAGDHQTASHLLAGLQRDEVRELGPDHRSTLATRITIANLERLYGDPEVGSALLRSVVEDSSRVLGPDHPDTMDARGSLITSTASVEPPGAVLAQLGKLLEQQTRVHGNDHANTLHTRFEIALLTNKDGDRERARQLLDALLIDQTRVLGPDSRETLTSRRFIALLTALDRDIPGAVDLLQTVLDDQTRLLGADHPETAETRRLLADLST